MSDITTLKCWPSVIFALDWSADGIIALASHDKVELLFPNIQAQEADSDIPQWRHFPLQVPWFSKEELAPCESAPFDIFSVGEEISTSYAVALAWSPPGLARHRRCALAVLTSNLRLSIWASEADVHNESNWERTLIINDTLKEYFSRGGPQSKSHVASDLDDIARIRERVRAFAWAPASPSHGLGGIVGTSTHWLCNLLAVSNDDNQIAIIAVHSPASTLALEAEWISEVLVSFSIEMPRPEVDIDSFDFDDIMGQQRHATKLAWSPWAKTETGLRSILAYVTNENVRLRMISYSDGKLELGDEKVLPQIELRYAGPIVWSPEVGEDGSLRLSYFSAKEVVFLNIASNDGSVLDQVSHHIDNRWDRISGAVWDTHDKARPRLHFSSHSTTTSSETAVLELSPDNVSNISTSDWPYWCEQISGSQGHFSAEHELGGHANARVWGLSASPLGESIASSHSVHPTDMIEYGQGADRFSKIAITDLWGDGSDFYFPAKAVTAEGIFFATRKWIEKNVESSDELPSIRAKVHEKLMEAYMPPQTDNSESEERRRFYETLDLQSLISTFKHNAFLDPNSLKDRYDILSGAICTPAEQSQLPRMLIAFRLANELSNLSESLSSSHMLSRRILKSHEHLIRLVEDLISEPTGTSADAEGDAEAPEDLPQTSPILGEETCIFCDAAIPFTDPASAACMNGHEFIRCGLSFLTIQMPGQTKTCGICKTPFLSEDAVFGENDEEFPPPSPGANGSGDKARNEESEDESSASLDGTQFDGARDRPRRRKEPSTRTEETHEADRPSTSSPSVDTYNITRANTHAQEGLPTLAQILFLACDVCIYCGGKFIG